MKMDEDYFVTKRIEIIGVVSSWNIVTDKIDTILHQIARDAAQAQREECFEWCRLKLLEGGCASCDSKKVLGIID